MTDTDIELITIVASRQMSMIVGTTAMIDAVTGSIVQLVAAYMKQMSHSNELWFSRRVFDRFLVSLPESTKGMPMTMSTLGCQLTPS